MHIINRGQADLHSQVGGFEASGGRLLGRSAWNTVINRKIEYNQRKTKGLGTLLGTSSMAWHAGGIGKSRSYAGWS